VFHKTLFNTPKHQHLRMLYQLFFSIMPILKNMMQLCQSIKPCNSNSYLETIKIIFSFFHFFQHYKSGICDVAEQNAGNQDVDSGVYSFVFYLEKRIVNDVNQYQNDINY
jgi:hypothetical protein